MKFYCIFLTLTVCGVSGQTWASRAKLENFNTYFSETMQQVILEVEKREWCNFKIPDNTVVVNEHMYKWHVTGNVTFANGFLLSIQKIDLSNIENVFSTRTINGTAQVTGIVRGRINLRNPSVGFDVIFKPEGDSVQHYTGVYTYNLINFEPSISKNFHTGEITATVDILNLNTGSTGMIFMPVNNVTEVLSRRSYVPSSIRSNVQQWGRGIIQPILEKLVTTKMEFPNICFVNC